MSTPAGDVAEARALFGGAKLPFPYVPAAMELAFLKRDRWCYATREVGRSPYDIRWYADEARTHVPDYVLLAHAGHGINSYAIHYFLVRGPLGLFLQAPWGGVYMEEGEVVDTMREHFGLAETLAKASEAQPVGHASERLVVFVSDFYGSWWTRPGVLFPTQDRSQPNGRDVLQAAIEWVRSQG